MRTASSTPGMNDSRAIESWRIVSVWPSAAEDDLLVGDEAREAHRVDRLVDVAARPRGSGRRCAPRCPTARRACGRGAARRSRTPACARRPRCATSIISTAPIAKFGATKRLALPTPSSSEKSAPVVPITQCTPASRQCARCASAVSGVREVDDDVGVAEHVGERDVERGSARPTSAMSSAPSTAAQTVCAHPPRGAGDGDVDHAAAAQRRADRRRSARAERRPRRRRRRRPTARSGANSSRASSTTSSSVTASKRGEHLVERQQRHAHQHASCRAGSCASSVDSIDSTVRPFTFSFARSSSSRGHAARDEAAQLGRRSPRIASPTLSGRVPT